MKNLHMYLIKSNFDNLKSSYFHHVTFILCIYLDPSKLELKYNT